MSGCRVSVIVPARDAAATLPALLDALTPQVHDHVEALVVDNGSSDRTRSIALGRGVRVIDEPRPGASAARNAGVRCARGALIAFLDSDCIPQPGWLQALTEPFEGNDALGAVGGRVMAAPAESLLQRYAQRVGYYVSQEVAMSDPFLPYVLTANCCYRREVIERLGGLDESLRSGEDTDLSWRMQLELGSRVSFAQRAVVEHVHRTTLSGMWRQWVRYGYGGVQLAERYPGISSPTGDPVRRLRRLVSELTASVTALARVPAGSADMIDVLAPWLRCFEVAADLWGRRQAGRALSG